jgi:uncharacterized protein
MSPPPHEQRKERFARIRRAKWFLRFMPRRARFHRYPLIGRFADMARKRDYLWSFRTESVRPALYVGAIVALLPLLGVQIAVAFVLALLCRANIMILVGLQFITTPLTAPPLYFATYHVGLATMESVGFDTKPHEVQNDQALIEELESIDQSIGKPQRTWSQRWGTTLIALVVGGMIVGSVVGLILDIIWRFASGQADAHRLRRAGQKFRSDSTPSRAPPK